MNWSTFGSKKNLDGNPTLPFITRPGEEEHTVNLAVGVHVLYMCYICEGPFYITGHTVNLAVSVHVLYICVIYVRGPFYITGYPIYIPSTWLWVYTYYSMYYICEDLFILLGTLYTSATCCGCTRIIICVIYVRGPFYITGYPIYIPQPGCGVYTYYNMCYICEGTFFILLGTLYTHRNLAVGVHVL